MNQRWRWGNGDAMMLTVVDLPESTWLKARCQYVLPSIDGGDSGETNPMTTTLI